MFSFAGDVVLDPFAGTGSTAVAAVSAGRSSISVDIEAAYVSMAATNIAAAIAKPKSVGATSATLKVIPESRKARPPRGRA